MNAKYYIGILIVLMFKGFMVKAQNGTMLSYRNNDTRIVVNNYYDDTPNIRFRLSFGYSPYWYHSWYDPWYDWHDFYWYNPWYYRYSYRYSPYRYYHRYYHRYYPRYYYHKPRPHHRYHASRRYHEYHRPKQQPTVVHRSSRNAVTTPRRTSTTQRSNYTRSYKPTYSEPNQYRHRFEYISKLMR